MTAGPVTYERARDWLIERASVVAGIPAHEVAIDVSFTDLGLTSASLAALTRELETFLGTSVDPAVPFEFPTIDKLARRLAAGHTTRRVASTTPSADVSVREIAIVGMACRFPEAESLDRFWKLLHHGMDGTSEVPAGRWEAGQPVHGTLPAGDGVALSRGGFINAIEWFDRRFFRIGAEEAARMDPQQRILLELCWEALEDAGELPSRLRGSRTGVYVGISTSEYLARLGDDPSPYVSTGNARSVAANRVSYLFDFRGPSISVDTACSSSLVAVHLACRGLRTGECDRAVVAGVNLMLDPRTTVWLSRAGLLSNEGRCKAFDASADGYVRAEGCGVVVLKGLDAARAANDRIYAIVRGSAVNQDGTTNGLTAPNPSAQRAVVRDAYRDADLDPTRVGYVECHGTGTALGDPIEARSLSAVVRPRGPSGDVCLIGSVKTNVGHLEAAAGIAGLIKVALSLHHGEIPPSLHFRDANPHIPFEELALRVATRPAPWPAQDRLAGVSSFGFGGTNAHVVVASGPPIPDRSPRPGPLILPVSAPTATGLGRLVRAWSRRLATTTETDLGDVLHAAAVRRTHHPAYRRAFTGTDPDDLRDQVDTAARRGTGRQRIAPAATPRVMFVFSGHCAELPSGVVQALAEHPLFANTLQRCDEVLSAQRPSPVEEMPERAHDPGAVDAGGGLPRTVSIQVALAQLWRAVGIEPCAVIGYGVGELAAAIVAGTLDLEAGLRLAVEQERLPALCEGRLTGNGTGTRPVDEALWLRRLREPVQSAAAMAAALATGVDVALEIGAHGGLDEELHKIAEAAGVEDLAVVHSVGRATGQGPGIAGIVEPVARLYELGCAIRWEEVFRERSTMTSLPRHPWDRERLWAEPERPRGTTATEAAAHAVDQLDRDGDADLPDNASRPGSDRAGDNGSDARSGAEAGGLEGGNGSGPVPGAPQEATFLYELVWRPSEIHASATGAGCWVVAGDSSPLVDGLVRNLQARGVETVVCRRGPCFAAHSAREFEIDPLHRGDYDRLLATLNKTHQITGLVHLFAMEAALDTEGARRAGFADPAVSALHLVQALSSAAASEYPRLVFVTRESQAVGTAGVDRPLASTIWGLLKTASLENPLLSVRCLDLDRDAGVEEVWGELTAEDRESEVAYRDGRRHVRRLVQRPPSCPPSERRFVVRSDATYVVTGGTGSLGRLVARRLSERGAGRIVLLARKADECSAEDLSALAANPATDMVALPVDVSDREAVQEALRAARAAGPPVRGVVHAAGVLADRVLFDVTAESMRAVLAPKVMGAWTMHELTAEDPLDWFVLFSSAAGILGSPGQSSYSAANAFLDALAHHRRARGLPGIAIDWGPWAEVGMAAGVSDDIRRRRLGTAVSALDPGTGLSLFERLVREDLAQSVVLPFDLRDLLQFHPALDTTSFFDEVVQDATLSAMTTAARGTSMRPDLSTAYVAPRNPIEQRIAALWQASLGIAPVGVNDSFFELGGDSVLANQLLVEINRALDVRLDTGQAFEQLTVGHLAELAEEAVVRALALMDDDSAERLLQVPPPTDN